MKRAIYTVALKVEENVTRYALFYVIAGYIVFVVGNLLVWHFHRDTYGLVMAGLGLFWLGVIGACRLIVGVKSK